MALEVGTEGKLGGQAVVRGVAGVWKDLTDSVNSWPATSPARSATSPRSPPPSPTATSARRSPSTSRARSSSSRTPSTRWSTSSTASPREVTRVAREVGTEGQLGGQAQVQGVAGVWKDLTDSVN